MQYAIISTIEPERHIELFATGAFAGKRAAELNAAMQRDGHAMRFRVVPIKSDDPANDDWKARERGRIIYGVYKPVPWSKESWSKVDHFAHVSTEDEGKIAFTPNAEYGVADRQIRMRPGRYLTTHYADVLTSEQIKSWCAKIAAESNALKFAHTPDEIQHVYENGPTSCMSHKAADYESSCHPVRVYGAGDLAIAYTVDPENSDRVTARTLCWPQHKIHGRVYGDENLLCELLSDAAYRKSTSSNDWDGARLLRIEEDGGFVAPYLDHPNYNVDDDGEFLTLGGDIECRDTNGLCKVGSRYYCQRCEEGCDEINTVDGEEWCDYCYENHSYRCNDCDSIFAGEAYLCDHHGNDICERCAEEYSTCVVCDEYHHGDDLIYSEVTHESYCEYCAGRMMRTPCGEIADDKNDCDCAECAEYRIDQEVENFALSSDDTTIAEQPEHFVPVVLSRTCPTIEDWRQLELTLRAA